MGSNEGKKRWDEMKKEGGIKSNALTFADFYYD